MESEADLLQRLGTDGAKWAAEFRQTAIKLGYPDMDEGWLIGWFANAIEAGRAETRWHKDYVLGELGTVCPGAVGPK